MAACVGVVVCQIDPVVAGPLEGFKYLLGPLTSSDAQIGFLRTMAAAIRGMEASKYYR